MLLLKFIRKNSPKRLSSGLPLCQLWNINSPSASDLYRSIWEGREKKIQLDFGVHPRCHVQTTHQLSNVNEKAKNGRRLLSFCRRTWKAVADELLLWKQVVASAFAHAAAKGSKCKVLMIHKISTLPPPQLRYSLIGLRLEGIFFPHFSLKQANSGVISRNTSCQTNSC